MYRIIAISYDASPGWHSNILPECLVTFAGDNGSSLDNARGFLRCCSMQRAPCIFMVCLDFSETHNQIMAAWFNLVKRKFVLKFQLIVQAPTGLVAQHLFYNLEESHDVCDLFLSPQQPTVALARSLKHQVNYYCSRKLAQNECLDLTLEMKEMMRSWMHDQNSDPRWTSAERSGSSPRLV